MRPRADFENIESYVILFCLLILSNILKCTELNHFLQQDIRLICSPTHFFLMKLRTINHLCCSLNSADIWRVGLHVTVAQFYKRHTKSDWWEHLYPVASISLHALNKTSVRRKKKHTDAGSLCVCVCLCVVWVLPKANMNGKRWMVNSTREFSWMTNYA